MIYSRFIFGDFKGKSTKDKQFYLYRAFVDPLGSKPETKLAWMSKLRINQARLVSKMENGASLNMVPLLPRSTCALPRPSFTLKRDQDESLLPWDHLPSSFNLNFAAICPHTCEPLAEYSFPYYSSFFQAPSQLLHLETRINPFANARQYNFLDYFRHLKEIPLDYYSPNDIKKLLYFIPGDDFHWQQFDDHTNEHVGFFLFHFVSANMLVPISHTMVMTLLNKGLPGDPSIWSTLLHDLHDFSLLLRLYYQQDFFHLQGPLPHPEGREGIYLVQFHYPTDDRRGPNDLSLCNFYVPDPFYHPDPIKKWVLL